MNLNELATTANVEEEVDSLGGRGVLDTNIYNCIISQAYLGKSAGGALNVTIIAKTEAEQEIRETIYISSGDAKGNKTTYERNGKEYYLPGYLTVNNICKLAIGKEIPELETVTKTLKIWNSDAKKELPTEVEVLDDLDNAEIVLAVEKQVVDKTKNVAAEGAKPDYQPTGETREQNEIVKVFHPENGMTSTEIKAGLEEAVFAGEWLKKNEGKVKNKAKGAAEGGTAGVATQGADASKPATKSLFAKKDA